MNRPCLPYFDADYRLTRLIMSGLGTAPEFSDNGTVVRIVEDGVALVLKCKTAVEREGIYKIKL